MDNYKMLPFMDVQVQNPYAEEIEQIFNAMMMDENGRRNLVISDSDIPLGVQAGLKGLEILAQRYPDEEAGWTEVYRSLTVEEFSRAQRLLEQVAKRGL